MHKTEIPDADAFFSLSATSSALFVTLAARAVATKHAPDTGFSDPYAAAILERLPKDLTAVTDDSQLVRSIILRAALFDTLASDFIQKHPGTICVDLGCGLCSRGQRLRDSLGKNADFEWYDLDLPEVIAVRNRFADILTRDKAIACTLTDLGWLDRIGSRVDRPLLLVMEGVAPYLPLSGLEAFMEALAEQLMALKIDATFVLDFVHPAFTGEKRPLLLPETTK
jgi:O-methyltransferase involved in polyketide biosynthesis